MPHRSVLPPRLSDLRRALLVCAASALSAGALAAGCSAESLSGDPTGGNDGPSGSSGGGARCVEEGQGCPVSFSYQLHNEKSVELRGSFAPDGWEKGIPMQLDGVAWTTTLEVPSGTTIEYKFFVDGTTWVTDPVNPNKKPDGAGGENALVTASCATTANTCQPPGPDGGPPPDADPPAGTFDWRSAVLYFVFVDRFNNGDTSNDTPVPDVEAPANYQGGDFQGVIQKLDEGYFDDLGVNALWLTVPFDNPQVAGAGADGHAYSAYHGYWPSDLTKIEEHFGSEMMLETLVDKAHGKGIKVLLDYAMNHVHSASPLVTEHPDWFWPLDYNGKYCVCGDGCDWNNDYEQKRCWFRDYLPDWNFQNEQARAYSVNNAVDWIKKTGIDGYRLDAVKHIETVWIEDLRKRVDAEVDKLTGERFYMVGETFESGNRDILAKYVAPQLLDGQFDFPLRGVLVEKVLRRTGTMYELDDFLKTNDTYYNGVMSTFIGNHDLARVIQTALDEPWGAWDNGGNSNWESPPALPGGKAPFERVAVAFAFLYTTKGVPLVYYGDEIGMAGAGDPDNRRFMQWDGITANQTWLREQLSALGKIRKDHPALWKGTRTTVSVTQDTYGYRMSDGKEEVFVALNRGDVAGGVSGLPTSAKDLLTGATVAGPTVTLAPRTAMILIVE
ncbi:MAG: alpha-amylase family glycosyl hydrolase [Polyangiaceae bacterium]